jgi:hypothetical protein
VGAAQGACSSRRDRLALLVRRSGSALATPTAPDP